MKILVGMSGGVDSSTTALLLKQQGHEVIGATMSIWGDNGIKKQLEQKGALKNLKGGACLGPDEEEDIEAARSLCSQIGIPFYVFDCADDYEKIVLTNFRKEYLSGNTPNPCVWCNSLIKFGALPKMAKASGVEFDKFATGHYARIVFENNKYVLKRGIDPKKDQSYFLYRLKQEQLANILLPLGGYTKEEIRHIAGDFGLQSAEKPDSQDFYAGDYNDLLNMPEKEGNIIDTEGNVLGKHKGFWNYTIGQRRGLKIASSAPLYVLELRSKTNEVVVGSADKTMKDKLIATNLKFNFDSIPTECLAKFRSTQTPTPVQVSKLGDRLSVKFMDMQKSIATGQSVVLYDNDTVLGGGIITEVI